MRPPERQRLEGRDGWAALSPADCLCRVLETMSGLSVSSGREAGPQRGNAAWVRAPLAFLASVGGSSCGPSPGHGPGNPRTP